jgi:hypothetical protein
LPAATADAAVPDAVAQDDPTVVCNWHNRESALEQMRAAGFTHVRINLLHAPGPDGAGLIACPGPAAIEVYDEAVAAVVDAGLVPQLTLLWYGQSDPTAIAAWMGQMAAHFAPVVQRFSVMNEPDLRLPANNACDPETVEQMVTVGTLTVTTRMRWIKVYLRHRVSIRRRGRTIRVWRNVHRLAITRVRRGGGYRYRLSRVRAVRWVRRPIRATEEGTESSPQRVLTVRKGCLRVQRGRMYHRIFMAAEPAIRAAAPHAQVLAGETSPAPGVDLFIQNALPLPADGWAHHCYQWDLTPSESAHGFGIGDTDRVQALVGMPLFYTECGYPNPGSQWGQTRFGLFTPENLPGAYAEMWQYARDHGVREMSQYEWCASLPGRWDTSLMTHDDCGANDAYLAIQRVITSWH